MTAAVIGESFSGFRASAREDIARRVNRTFVGKSEADMLDGDNLEQKLANAKVMTLLATFIKADQETQEVSARFSDGYLVGRDMSFSYPTSANMIERTVTESQAELTKELLSVQLTSHPLQPIGYQLDVNSKAIEFFNHPSHLVCVIDHDGMQLLWKSHDKNNSEILGNSRLAMEYVSQKIALILHSERCSAPI